MRLIDILALAESAPNVYRTDIEFWRDGWADRRGYLRRNGGIPQQHYQTTSGYRHHGDLTLSVDDILANDWNWLATGRPA